MTADPIRQSVEAIAAEVAKTISEDAFEMLRARIDDIKRLDCEELRTVKQITEECPAFGENRLRCLIKRAASNGLNEMGVIYRDGRRVMIHRGKFNRWCETKRSGRPLTRRPRRRGSR